MHVARYHGCPREHVASRDGDGVEELAGPRDPARPREASDHRGVGRRVLPGHFVEQLEGGAEAACADEGGEHGFPGDLVPVGQLLEQLRASSSSPLSPCFEIFFDLKYCDGGCGLLF